jgi:hypothetical protein
MSRFFAFALASFCVGAALVAGLSAGCGDAGAPSSDDLHDGSYSRRDSSPVDPPSEAGAIVEAGPEPTAPSCAAYCELVMANCTADNAQYASKADCLAFCKYLPLTREGEEKAAASVACRQYWADSPAHTNPKDYCLAAGPFGGNACGDRCTAFCDVLMSVCSPDGGVAAYESTPECATACVGFSYRDAGADGGGEGPGASGLGDTLNCRLHELRLVTADPKKCSSLSPDGGVCEPRR